LEGLINGQVINYRIEGANTASASAQHSPSRFPTRITIRSCGRSFTASLAGFMSSITCCSS